MYFEYRKPNEEFSHRNALSDLGRYLPLIIGPDLNQNRFAKNLLKNCFAKKYLFWFYRVQ